MGRVTRSPKQTHKMGLGSTTTKFKILRLAQEFCIPHSTHSPEQLPHCRDYWRQDCSHCAHHTLRDSLESLPEVESGLLKSVTYVM